MNQPKSHSRLIVMVLLAFFLIPVTCIALNSDAQASSDLVSVTPMSFHYYSLIEKAQDNSSFVYNGVDGYGPKLSAGFTTNLNCQTYGQREMFGQMWDYWSASIMWKLDLKEDVRVKGDVEIKVYISSLYRGMGFFDGGGFGMGLVDFDEEGNEVKAFTAEGSGGIGNPFSSTPTAYVLTIPVDYVFKNGHSVGFFIGAGSTRKGFTFNVHFDASNTNSGVTLPIENNSKNFNFNTIKEGIEYEVIAVSNSSLSNFVFNQPENQIKFRAFGIPGIGGYCTVWMPKNLLKSPFKVMIDDHQAITSESENTTHSSIHFKYINDVNVVILEESAVLKQLSYVTILPTSTTINIGDSQQFFAQGYDQNNNLISNLSFTWSVTGEIGIINSTFGETATFKGLNQGKGSLTAMTTYEGVTKSGNVSIIVTSKPSSSNSPPTITHTAITSANSGQNITISTKVTDDVKVDQVTLYFKKSTDNSYTKIIMALSENTYYGVIPDSIVTTVGIQYYINATDGTNFSNHPALNSTVSAHWINVSASNQIPIKTELNSPTNITENSLILIWKENTETDFNRYEIYQSNSFESIGTKISTISDKSVTSYVVTNLSANTDYYFTVRVVDSAELFSDSPQVIGTTKKPLENSTEINLIWILGIVTVLGVIFTSIVIVFSVLRKRN